MLIILLTLLAAVVQAQELDKYSIESVNTTFDIKKDGSVRQTSQFVFDRNLSNGTLTYLLNDNIRDIIARTGAAEIRNNFTREPEGYLFRMYIERPTNNITISYTATGVIFSSDSINHFFTELSYDQPVRQMAATAALPEGYALYNREYLPEDAWVGSDGRRITLTWNIARPANSTIFSVKYHQVGGIGNMWVMVPAITLVSGLAMAGLYFRFSRRTKEAFLKGFREDEKKAIGYLQLHKTIYQNKLHSEFSFSRAKATRIVMKFEEKGLVTKEKHGRTNKITWLGQ
ncbi:MAG: hypothetical protein HY544_00410 [Candidatus Diapherotrites archaeon]|uniref:DUF7343 domain-containing protein n=1 Tax=Candidatus Iainarchaeum sp. TaxID=3101447 RepID=A0A8T3YHG0_9ARCH|nr:hypothetical protein [Candidatus Diapherotrites archaeon]